MLNTVPFDKLGPGQSGRLAYQVLGQDGPIMNPQNIRYLSPDSVELPANAMDAGASGLATGLAGANLICSFLNLGVSVYIASQVAGLHRKMDRLQETVDRIEPKVDYIVSKVDRIDIQVAENNLRHALDYVLRQAVSGEGVDLQVLSGLRDDIDKFTDSLSSPHILNFGLRLSSDIRGRLQKIYYLLCSVRKLTAQRYNIAVGGDPERIITTNPTDGYFFLFGGNLEILVRATMTLSSDGQEGGNQFEKMGLIDIDAYLPERHPFIFQDEAPETAERVARKGGWIWPTGIDGNSEAEAVKQGLYDLGCAWLHHTDSGLLFRTWMELEAIAKGYEGFWPQLKEATPCGFDQIDVVTDLALIENV